MVSRRCRMRMEVWLTVCWIGRKCCTVHFWSIASYSALLDRTVGPYRWTSGLLGRTPHCWTVLLDRTVGPLVCRVVHCSVGPYCWTVLLDRTVLDGTPRSASAWCSCCCWPLIGGSQCLGVPPLTHRWLVRGFVGCAEGTTSPRAHPAREEVVCVCYNRDKASRPAWPAR